jgi:NitT/TauT family transport system permease protein
MSHDPETSTDHPTRPHRAPPDAPAVPIASAGPLPEADLTLATITPTRGAGRWRQSVRTIVSVIVFLMLVAVVWEGVKWVGGDPWRYDDFLGIGTAYFHDPPLRITQASDRQLPHLWDIAGAFSEPFQRSADQTLGQYLSVQALFTWREAALGFALGTVIGIVLASVFVHFTVLERAFLPYVIASQTVPIVALAPIIVVGFGRGLTSIVIIATYLTFFPVTIAMTRGLRSPDPRAVELMRSYAASRWEIYRKVRLPASVPYLFTALKIAAAASVVGAIIGEGPGGVLEGLGRAILTFNQQYITGPEKLWATILVAAFVGIAFYLIVQAVEALVLRGRLAARP